MENTNQHSLFSKLMSFLFIAIGIFLGIYAFFADATSWTVNTGVWDNADYLSQTFWDLSPSDNDIITALYGSGDDDSVYTENWTGYTSGSCLNGGMSVVYTGNLSLTGLVENTIYVLTGHISTGSETIAMANCSAVISMNETGTIFYSTTQLTGGMFYTNNNYIIIDSISINGSGIHSANEYGIQLYQANNNTIHNSEIYNNNYGFSITSASHYNTIQDTTVYNNNIGIYITSSNNNTINNNQIYNNTNYGLHIGACFYNTINNSQFFNNNVGINIYNSNYSILSGIVAHDNSSGGVSASNSLYNEFYDLELYSNASFGIKINTGDSNILDTIQSYDNTEHNIYLENLTNSSITNIVANNSETEMGVYVVNSSGNIFSGVQAFGNYYAGIHFYNSDNNTGIHIISNYNEVGLYIENSIGNNFSNFITSNSPMNGVVFSGSSYNTLSGLVSNGNGNDSIYFYDSSYNTGTNISSNNNAGEGLELQENSSFNVFDNVTINNNSNGLWLESGTNNQILNSTINENGIGIYFTNSTSNIISGCILSGNINWGIELQNASNNNIIANSTGNKGLTISDSTGTNVSMTDIYSIWEQNISGLFLYTTYDTYTQDNNTISIISYNSNTAFITGNALPIGSIFDTYFDFLYMQTNLFPNPNNEITMYPDGLTVSGSAWDGNIYLPTPVIGSKLASIGETGTNNISEFLDTVEIISGNTYLTMMGEGIGYGEYILDSGISGQYLKVLKSINGSTWINNTELSGCILDEDKICEFDFMGDIKLFAFGVPTGLFTGTTFSGTTIISGGYYNTGVIITYENPNLSGATLNGNHYTGGTAITGDGNYVFVMEDTFSNATGITFTIDRITPVFTGTTLSLINVVSGGYYNTGVKITFADTNLSGAILSGLNGNTYYTSNYSSGTTIITGGIYRFTVLDRAGNSTGMIFTIDTTPPVLTGNSPTSGFNYAIGNNIAFTRTGTDTNMSGYTLYINSTGYAMGTATTHTTGLINGSYTRKVVGTDRAGNTGTSQIYPFSISTPFSGSISITGTKLIGSQRFTNSAVGIYMRANEPIDYTITGNVSNSPITETINSQRGWSIRYPILTGADESKYIFVTLSNTSGDSISNNFMVTLDTQTPAATPTSPASGSTVIGSPLLSWTMDYIDTVGFSGYEYYVSPFSGFEIIIASGFIPTTISNNYSVIIPSSSLIGLSNTNLYRKIKTIDVLGNYERTDPQIFYYSGSAIDTTPDTFSFTDITGADRNTTYISNSVTITGMTPGQAVLASINIGALYISGNFVGTTGYIQNGWTVSVELISSNNYNTTVSSTVTIGSGSDTFSVSTSDEDDYDYNYDEYDDNYDNIDTDLSITQRLQVIAIFESMRDVYAGDKEKEFFNTFMVVLQDRINDYDDNDIQYHTLTYLYDIIEQYYDGGDFGDNVDDTRWIINGVYTAPNGKKYTITYDATKQRFTSTNFVVAKYFPTLDTLKYIIDINNPVGSQYVNSKPISARFRNVAIDGTRQSSPYTAPNKKAYYFFKTIDGKYSSYTFSMEKWFSSLNDVKEFIYNNNR